jgi:hypothetical protein
LCTNESKCDTSEKEERMRRLLVITLATMILLGLTGCAALRFESTLTKDVSMTQTSYSYSRDFYVQRRALWLFWGIVPLSTPEVDEVVGGQISGSERVQNLKITTKYTLLDFLISGLTSGIVTSRKVVIEGEVY